MTYQRVTASLGTTGVVLNWDNKDGGDRVWISGPSFELPAVTEPEFTHAVLRLLNLRELAQAWAEDDEDASKTG